MGSASASKNARSYERPNLTVGVETASLPGPRDRLRGMLDRFLNLLRIPQHGRPKVCPGQPGARAQACDVTTRGHGAAGPTTHPWICCPRHARTLPTNASASAAPASRPAPRDRPDEAVAGARSRRHTRARRHRQAPAAPASRPSPAQCSGRVRSGCRVIMGGRDAREWRGGRAHSNNRRFHAPTRE